jgi:cytochrome c peroxidase
MKRWLLIFILAVLVISGPFLLDSCRHRMDPPPVTPVSFVIPAGFPAPVYPFASNPLTEEGILLGRKLFYDGRLSIDGNFPCSSCHQPVAAFTTYEHDRSHGYNHSHTLRNAPGLFNLAWYPYFNQDGGETSLHSLYMKHITDPGEMAETIPNVIDKLENNAQYRNMFRAAFGDSRVTPERISSALTQFLMNMVSANSKYDRVQKGQASFNLQEQNGYDVFMQKCVSCHAGPLFTDFSFRNTGMAMDINLQDLGRYRVTQDPADSLKFRVPSLRNLDFTSYYGHDGRFSLPWRMIDHYRFHVVANSTIDPALANGISLTNTEADNLVQFLRTLSDSIFLNDPRNRE